MKQKLARLYLKASRTLRRRAVSVNWKQSAIDGGFIGGFCALVYGIRLFSVPLGWVCGGLFAMVIFFVLGLSADGDRRR